MQKKIPLIIGIVLGIIAIFLVQQYISQQRQEVIRIAQEKIAQIQKDLVSVIVAKSNIPAGRVIETEDLEIKSVPKNLLQSNVVTSPEKAVGKMTVVPIKGGEQILLSQLTSTEITTTSSLATATPLGKRAITISVDNISSLGGMIKPGNYVDVIGMLNVPVTVEGKQTMQPAVIPLFQNVLVLAVGSHLAGAPVTPPKRGEQVKEEISPLITLALSPQEANLIAFIAEQGKIRLVLRSPIDSQIQPIAPASWETLFQYLYPQPKKEKEEIKEIPEEKPKREIEIYRGLQRGTQILKK